MTLKPKNKRHKAQILAGTLGRNSGHGFEKRLTEEINHQNWKSFSPLPLNVNTHIFVGTPSCLLLSYICAAKRISKLSSVKAAWLGGLATSRQGDNIIGPSGERISKSKSDILLNISHTIGLDRIGVSVKTCNSRSPTNDQLYFTTAVAFCGLLRSHNIPVSLKAEHGLKMFCGDIGYRPMDNSKGIGDRKSDPNRWFFEELSPVTKKELMFLFSRYQMEVTKILLQKAYKNDPYEPDFLLHQTKLFDDYEHLEIALFSIDELIRLSLKYNGFWTKPYIIRKGSHKGDLAVHDAPRFGFIQFQRGGQKQHPTQLQFNLEAGYFYKLPESP